MKKKILSLIISTVYFLGISPIYTLARPLDDPLNIAPPDKRAIDPNTSLNTILQNTITIVFIVAALVVLAMLIVGAFQWILSGGDKEAVGKARGRIINALIGLAVLALAFFIIALVGQLLGINIIAGKIPSLTGK